NGQVSSRLPILRHRIIVRALDVGLADQIVKLLRSIFSGKNLVAHRSNLIRSSSKRKQKTKKVNRITGFFDWTLDVERSALDVFFMNLRSTSSLLLSRHAVALCIGWLLLLEVDA